MAGAWKTAGSTNNGPISFALTAKPANREASWMKRRLRVCLGSGLIAAWLIGGPAAAQKQGGILHAGHFDSPASMSMLEESTLAVNRPMMGVFNNLVMFDQQVAQNSPQ